MAIYYLGEKPETARDVSLEIPRGNIPGLSSVLKYGRSTSIPAETTEEIWDGNAVYSFPATALITSISQTSDQVAMRGATIHIQGLAEDCGLVTEDVVLDASNTTTVVTLPTPLNRIFRAFVLADVVGDSPIRIHNAAETQDYAIISTGFNQTQMAIYTVPSGYVAYMTQYYASLNPAVNKDPTSMQIDLWSRNIGSGYAAKVEHTIGLDTDADSHFAHRFSPYARFEERTDLFITGSPVGKSADISAGFDLILEKKNNHRL